MTEDEIRRILGPMDCTVEPEHLHCSIPLIEWPYTNAYPPSYTVVLLDGTFTADELEAIAAWMRRKETP